MKQKQAILFTPTTNTVLSINANKLVFEGPIEAQIDLKDRDLGEVYRDLQQVKGLTDVQCLLPMHAPAKHIVRMRRAAVPAKQRTYIGLQYPSPAPKVATRDMRRLAVVINPEDLDDLV